MSRLRVILAGIVAALSLMVVTPGKSEASTPIYKGADETTTMQQPKVVPDSVVSYAYYAELKPGGVDVYQVYAKAGQTLNPTLRVPKDDSLKDFTPPMAIIGPRIGIPNVDMEAVGLKIRQQDLPPNVGVQLINFTGDVANRETESDSIGSYWKGQSYNSTYPQDGPYYIVIWDKAGKGGRYVLTIGTEDDFGLFDLIKYPYTWVKLNLWFGNWLAVVIAAIFLVIIIAAIVWLVRWQRRRPKPVTEEAQTPPSE